MPAEEHLQIIRQGVDVWNEWREKNPELIPDLHRANLDGANLNRANLIQANLIQAKPPRGEPQRGAPLRGEPHPDEPLRGEPHRDGFHRHSINSDGSSRCVPGRKPRLGRVGLGYKGGRSNKTAEPGHNSL